ncbi:MAG: 6-phosphofructokinase [Lentisphaerae bacterium]|nr:6-phosphofructokinase [Lentisphaerota bacterium]
MSTPKKQNMLIAQSGGPSMVINQSLVGAVIEAKKQACIGRIFGSLHGIKGILEEDLIDLRKESAKTLEAVAATPSSGLGTVRMKPSPADCTRIFEILRDYDVGYFFYIGGNDSAETVHIINQEAIKAKHLIRCFHIPKTIDNDLRSNDHTPGFGSAARFVACALMGDNLDNRALPGVKIDVIMGRHAGFLTAAAALGRTYEDDGPHLIYLPERPFSLPQFVKDVKAVYSKYGRCLVAVSEGIQDSKGVAIAAKFSKEVDSHGNVQLSGTGALGDLLAAELKARSSIKRVRADTFGYLQRSFPDCLSAVDSKEARAVGGVAVKTACQGVKSGSIAIKRKPGKTYKVSFERVPLKSVARDAREMPATYINKAGNDVTQAFIDYAAPIVGPLPKPGRLKGVKVKK